MIGALSRLIVGASLLAMSAAAGAAYYAFAGGAFTFNSVPQVTVPAVIGDSLTDADAALEAVGLDTGTVTMRCSVAPANQVLSQNPVAGSLIAAGSTVDLSASNGTACTNRPRRNALNIGIGLGL